MLTLSDAIKIIAAVMFPLGFDVSPDAPSTLETLTARCGNGQRMVVWDGGSEATIYGDAAANYAFRAWHDWHHIDGQLPFTQEGEAQACERQCADLVAVYGDNDVTREWCATIRAEIKGQFEYAARHGDFPKDQAAFVRAYLISPYEALSRVF